MAEDRLEIRGALAKFKPSEKGQEEDENEEHDYDFGLAWGSTKNSKLRTKN